MYLQKHKIAQEKVISKEENEVVLQLTFTEDCDFFDGHFPQIHLVPAVAQIDIASHLIRKYFGLKGNIISAKRLKFSAPVFPNSTVDMSLKYNIEKSSITYKLVSSTEEKTYSSGAFVIE